MCLCYSSVIQLGLFVTFCIPFGVLPTSLFYIFVYLSFEYGKHPCSSKSQNYAKRNTQRNITFLPFLIPPFFSLFWPIHVNNQSNISFWIHPSCISSCRSDKAHVYSYTFFFLIWKAACYRYSFALCFFPLDNISWQSRQVISWTSSSFFFAAA